MKKELELMMRHKGRFYVVAALMLALTVVTGYFIYTISLLAGIENFIRLVISFILFIILILFFLFAKKILIKNKRIGFIIILITSIIYFNVSLFLSMNVNKIYNKLNKVTNTTNVYSTSLVTSTDNKVDNILKIDNGDIGLLNDEGSIDGYQIAKEIIKDQKLTNKLVYYEGYVELIEALKENKVKYVFLPTNYKISFNNMEGISDYLEETKIIYTKEKKIIKKQVTRGNVIDKPFTMLLMGVDSEVENIANSSFNGDALMVVTFNPKTLNTTIVSIPRDSYVPISCFPGKRKNKITHAAWYGQDCMQKTIESLFDIKIDYYFKMNFKGLVKLVDALGGVDVDVPYQFCEQDSNRRWGKNTIYVKKGLQTLNGEQALALSRNRHNNANRCGSVWGYGLTSDIVRGQNQQLVIKGILNKAKNIKKIDALYEILDTISESMETNMSTTEILSFYNIGKDIINKSKANNIDEIIKFEKLILKTYGMNIMDYSEVNGLGMKRVLSNQIPYKGSIRDVTDAMKINLGLRESKIIKTFVFNINEPYKEKVIGNDYYNEAGIRLLPNFVGKNESEAKTFANNTGLKFTINYVTSTSRGHKIGQIIKQSPFAKMDMDYVRTLTIDVVEKLDIKSVEPTTPNCSLEENYEDELCKLPNFVGKDISYFESWQKKHPLSIIFNPVKIAEDDPNYDSSKSGLIIWQSQNEGVYLHTLLGDSLEIKYMAKKVVESDPIDETQDSSGDDSNIIDLVQ